MLKSSMDAFVYLFALLGFLFAAKWLAGTKYENDCFRAYERKQAEARECKLARDLGVRLDDTKAATCNRFSGTASSNLEDK